MSEMTPESYEQNIRRSLARTIWTQRFRQVDDSTIRNILYSKVDTLSSVTWSLSHEKVRQIVAELLGFGNPQLEQIFNV